MSLNTKEVASVQYTEHPHIVRVSGVCGGRPIIKGSRLAVSHIAHLYKIGDTMEEILHAYPHIQAAAVYDAISYYLDHQQEIEQEIAEGRLDALKAKSAVSMDDRGFIRFTDDAPAQ
jgi:uncharacterized protein (DUF433 family)